MVIVSSRCKSQLQELRVEQSNTEGCTVIIASHKSVSMCRAVARRQKAGGSPSLSLYVCT